MAGAGRGGGRGRRVPGLTAVARHCSWCPIGNTPHHVCIIDTRAYRILRLALYFVRQREWETAFLQSLENPCVPLKETVEEPPHLPGLPLCKLFTIQVHPPFPSLRLNEKLILLLITSSSPSGLRDSSVISSFLVAPSSSPESRSSSCAYAQVPPNFKTETNPSLNLVFPFSV